MVQTLFFSQLKIAIQDYYDQGVKKYTGNYGTQPIREENYIQPDTYEPKRSRDIKSPSCKHIRLYDLFICTTRYKTVYLNWLCTIVTPYTAEFKENMNRTK